MSLPPILRHVYNHGTEEVIRRGKKIFYTSGVQMLDVDHLLEQVRFRVRNDLYQNYYTVTINKYLQPKDLSVRCQCPYNLGEICRHEVAALFQLNDIVQSGFFENTDITYDQKHTVVRMRQVSMQMLSIFASPEIMEKAHEWAAKNRAIITTNRNDTIEAEVPDNDETYKTVIKQNEERYFDTSCGCDEKHHPLCVHKATLFLQILNTFGPQYFQTMQDWSEQKNKLLRQYGYSLVDDLTNKFTFTYENGKPFLRVLDPTIKKVAASDNLRTERVETEVIDDEKRLGIVIDSTVSWYPFVNVLLVAGTTDEEEKKFINGVDKLELQQYINTNKYREEERELIPIIRKFTPEEILKYLRKNLPFGDFLDDYAQALKDKPADDIKEQVWEYLLPKYQKLFERFRSHPLCFLHDQKKSLSSTSLQPIEFADKVVHPQLNVVKDNDDYIVNLAWGINARSIMHKEVQMLNPALLLHEYSLYCIGNIPEIQIVEQFMPDGQMRISAAEWPVFLEQQMMEWSHILHVSFAEDLVEHVDKVKPTYHLYLQEREQMLILK